MANALLKLENINVITVNWGDLSSGVYQLVVLVNMPKAGNYEFWLFIHIKALILHFWKTCILDFG